MENETTKYIPGGCPSYITKELIIELATRPKTIKRMLETKINNYCYGKIAENRWGCHYISLEGDFLYLYYAEWGNSEYKWGREPNSIEHIGLCFFGVQPYKIESKFTYSIGE